MPSSKSSRRPASCAAPTLESVEPRLMLSAGLPRPAHVVVVMEENHSYNEIMKPGAAPYFQSLARSSALMTNSFANTHPSLLDYLDIFSGSTRGLQGDATPDNPLPGPDLAGLLIQHGQTFAGYSEGLPYAGYVGDDVGNYVRRHAPWTEFADVPPEDSRPLSAFPKNYGRLPTVSFVTPDLTNDMHDGSIARGDQWLKKNLDGYVRWARMHSSVLIIQWDESDSDPNHIPTLIAGARIKPGRYAEPITHFNILRTIEDFYGIGHAGASAHARPIADIFHK